MTEMEQQMKERVVERQRERDNDGDQRKKTGREEWQNWGKDFSGQKKGEEQKWKAVTERKS